MRQLLCTLLLLCTAFAMQAQSSCQDAAWINEFHYDNDGGDVGEFVEVVLAPDLSASDYDVVLYNGSNGTSYNTLALSGATMTTDAASSYQIFLLTLPANGLQNGSPDGIALVTDGTVVEFISYEGSFAATNGPANGMTSTDIGVNESGSTSIGESLQKTGTGNVSGDFTFQAPMAETPGALNTGQTITTCETEMPDPECATAAWINEFHYDNDGGDVGEFVEVVLAPDLSASDYDVVLYNGSNGTSYNTLALSGATMTTDAASSYQIFLLTLPANGLQNGSPDGIALVTDGTVVEFISYEGSFAATNGPANGMTSTDIGVNESGSTSIGESLQKTGTGNVSGDFTFQAPMAETPGALNTGQTITTCGEVTPTCSITNVVITEGPTCDGDDSFFDISFDVSGGSGEYTIITPGAELYGTALATGVTEGTVMAEGQANAPASVMEGTMAEVVIVDAVNETCQSTPIDIFIPVCPPVTCAEEGDIFINEIHYDNIGTDVNEFVEVAVANVADIDVADFTVTFYNGSNGTSYNSETLDNFVEGEDDGTYTYYSLTLPSNGIQNGAPDGLALSCTEALVEFLSYEGTFEAADGPAMGVTSTDIGVAEGSGTGEFASLQLVDVAPGNAGSATSYRGPIEKQWVVTECNTKGVQNAVITAPSAAAVGVGTKTFCKSDDLTPSLANTGISVDFSLAANEKIVWALFSVPAGSSYSVGDEFTTDDCGDAFKNFGDFAVANSSKVIRVQDIANIMPGTYSFEVFVENCATGCRSISEIGFSITVNEATSVMITADPDGDLCLGQEGVQYGADITSTDGGTYTYAWCAYNSGDGSGTCFNGFDDNTAAMPTRDWTTSAGPKSVGVTVMSDNPGCTAEDLYSFEVVAPTMVECPADQMATLITDSETFDCVAEVTFNNPSVEMTPCIPTLTISIDGGASETVVPGEPYTFMTDDLGEYEVTYTLTDQVGNESSCSFTIFVDGLPCGFVDDGGIGECAGSNPTSMFDQDAEAFAVTSNGCVPEFPYIEDEQGFTYTQLCGDGYIEVFVDNITNKGIGGIQLRESTAPGSKKVEIATDRVARLFRSVRVVDNYPAFPQQILSFDKFWLKIERTGNTFKASASVDGVMYIPYVFQTVQMSECLVAGMFATSTNEEDVVTATFTNVTVAGEGEDALQSVPQTIAQSNTADANLSIGLAPNPAKEQVTLNMDQLIGEAATISIFNINGQLMNTVQYDSVENASETLNISNLPAGTYFVNVRTAQEQQTLRLIKQ